MDCITPDTHAFVLGQLLTDMGDEDVVVVHTASSAPRADLLLMLKEISRSTGRDDLLPDLPPAQHGFSYIRPPSAQVIAAGADASRTRCLKAVDSRDLREGSSPLVRRRRLVSQRHGGFRPNPLDDLERHRLRLLKQRGTAVDLRALRGGAPPAGASPGRGVMGRLALPTDPEFLSRVVEAVAVHNRTQTHPDTHIALFLESHLQQVSAAVSIQTTWRAARVRAGQRLVQKVVRWRAVLCIQRWWRVQLCRAREAMLASAQAVLAQLRRIEVVPQVCLDYRSLRAADRAVQRQSTLHREHRLRFGFNFLGSLLIAREAGQLRQGVPQWLGVRIPVEAPEDPHSTIVHGPFGMPDLHALYSQACICKNALPEDTAPAELLEFQHPSDIASVVQFTSYPEMARRTALLYCMGYDGLERQGPQLIPVCLAPVTQPHAQGALQRVASSARASRGSSRRRPVTPSGQAAHVRASLATVVRKSLPADSPLLAYLDGILDGYVQHLRVQQPDAAVPRVGFRVRGEAARARRGQRAQPGSDESHPSGRDEEADDGGSAGWPEWSAAHPSGACLADASSSDTAGAGLPAPGVDYDDAWQRKAWAGRIGREERDTHRAVISGRLAALQQLNRLIVYLVQQAREGGVVRRCTATGQCPAPLYTPMRPWEATAAKQSMAEAAQDVAAQRVRAVRTGLKAGLEASAEQQAVQRAHRQTVTDRQSVVIADMRCEHSARVAAAKHARVKLRGVANLRKQQRFYDRKFAAAFVRQSNGLSRNIRRAEHVALRADRLDDQYQETQDLRYEYWQAQERVYQAFDDMYSYNCSRAHIIRQERLAAGTAAAKAQRTAMAQLLAQSRKLEREARVRRVGPAGGPGPSMDLYRAPLHLTAVAGAESRGKAKAVSSPVGPEGTPAGPGLSAGGSLHTEGSWIEEGTSAGGDWPAEWDGADAWQTFRTQSRGAGSPTFVQ